MISCNGCKLRISSYQLVLISCNSCKLRISSYQLVLVSCNRCELSLLEDEAPVELLLNVPDRLTRIPLSPPHQVDPGLELVHRVQDHLQDIFVLIHVSFGLCLQK